MFEYRGVMAFKKKYGNWWKLDWPSDIDRYRCFWKEIGRRFSPYPQKIDGLLPNLILAGESPNSFCDLLVGCWHCVLPVKLKLFGCPQGCSKAFNFSKFWCWASTLCVWSGVSLIILTCMQSPAHVLHATLLVGLVGVGEGGHNILLHLRT